MSALLDKVNWIDLFALIFLLRISYASSVIGVGKQILPLVFLFLVLPITLYSYSILASFLIKAGIFTPSISRFLSYVLILCLCFIVHRVLSQIAGFGFFSRKEAKSGLIENIGGTLVGVFRSVLIVGMIIIAIGLMPVRGLEGAVRDSYSGVFFIDINLRIYNSMISLVMKKSAKPHYRTVRQILSEKEKYMFDSLNVRNKSKFFKNTY